MADTNYAEKILPIMRRVRPLVLPHWGTAQTIHQKDDSAVNVVTQLDLDVEEMVSAALAKMYPDIEFVGEERGGNREADSFWLMDPIDGTGLFIRGLPGCTSMLALIRDGVVVFSAVYDFVNDFMYWAERGKGAFCDKERLRVSDRPLGRAYLGWETHLDKKENEQAFHALRKMGILFKSVNAGWELAMVAAGRLDARISFDPFGKDYDFAPGSLLVSEAGGVVANIGSKDYDYRNTSFIAANPVIYKELTEVPNALFPVKK
jgi:myo-inositol-1(or 4)-monophosphatase